MSFSYQKGEFDRFFNRLDRPVKESRPDRQPDLPVDPTGACRPDQFPSLMGHFHGTQNPGFFKNLNLQIPGTVPQFILKHKFTAVCNNFLSYNIIFAT